MWRHRTQRGASVRRRGRSLLRLVVVGEDHERAVLVRQLARWCWPGGRCCLLVGLVVDADGAGFTSGAGLLLRIWRVGLALESEGGEPPVLLVLDVAVVLALARRRRWRRDDARAPQAALSQAGRVYHTPQEARVERDGGVAEVARRWLLSWTAPQPGLS